MSEPDKSDKSQYEYPDPVEAMQRSASYPYPAAGYSPQDSVSPSPSRIVPSLNAAGRQRCDSLVIAFGVGAAQDIVAGRAANNSSNTSWNEEDARLGRSDSFSREQSMSSIPILQSTPVHPHQPHASSPLSRSAHNHCSSPVTEGHQQGSQSGQGLRENWQGGNNGNHHTAHNAQGMMSNHFQPDVRRNQNRRGDGGRSDGNRPTQAADQLRPPVGYNPYSGSGVFATIPTALASLATGPGVGYQGVGYQSVGYQGVGHQPGVGYQGALHDGGNYQQRYQNAHSTMQHHGSHHRNPSSPASSSSMNDQSPGGSYHYQYAGDHQCQYGSTPHNTHDHQPEVPAQYSPAAASPFPANVQSSQAPPTSSCPSQAVQAHTPAMISAHAYYAQPAPHSGPPWLSLPVGQLPRSRDMRTPFPPPGGRCHFVGCNEQGFVDEYHFQ